MFIVAYDERVAGDLSQLTKSVRERIKQAIASKLTANPEIFGKPLRHSLFGFKSLRVGDYRVIYLIQKNKVLVILIAHRRDVYELADKLLR
jgi:mRNA interferase RelE/StbE